MSSPASIQAEFTRHVIARLQDDPRIEAVLVAGSPITKTDDAYSDVDLMIVCRKADYDQTMNERRTIASSLGNLLAAFTGEHVGEPRVLICLYDNPLLHVDLKFVLRDALADRVETPLLVYDRHGTIDAALRAGTAAWPARSPEWFEERFWIWAHYGAAKIARGELFDAHDMLAFVRSQVLGPMLARNGAQRQRGVRRIEFEAPQHVTELAQTIARYDRTDCWRALEVTIALYRKYRQPHPPANPRIVAEQAVVAYITRQTQNSVRALR